MKRHTLSDEAEARAVLNSVLGRLGDSQIRIILGLKNRRGLYFLGQLEETQGWGFFCMKASATELLESAVLEKFERDIENLLREEPYSVALVLPVSENSGELLLFVDWWSREPRIKVRTEHHSSWGWFSPSHARSLLENSTDLVHFQHLEEMRN